MRPSLAAVGVALLALVPSAAPAVAKTRTGPSGTAFYRPPSPLPGKRHGDLIWARNVAGPGALPGARSTRLVLYRSSGVRNRSIAVSGTVSIPKGKAPKSGWPVITWAHGTTGIADSCAPSRNPTDPLTAYVFPTLTRWLQHGYAVVRTDYEGLGTPGDHPFLNGPSEGRGVLDIVRAARRLDPRIGRRVVIAGHSQGGQAALFAAGLAPTWTPDLAVRGTLAFAPVTHLSEQLPLARGLKDPNASLSSFAIMIARGLDLAEPRLKVPSLLGDRVAGLYPLASRRCLLALREPDAFGNVAPAEIFRDGADLTAVAGALNRDDDAENLRIRTPVRIEQGTNDTTVFPSFTDQTVKAYRDRKLKVVYRTYQGVGHGDVVGAAASDADKALRGWFGG